jgi:hypothetical protein
MTDTRLKTDNIDYERIEKIIKYVDELYKTYEPENGNIEYGSLPAMRCDLISIKTKLQKLKWEKELTNGN